MLRRLGWASRARLRAPPSGADPSLLAGEPIETEDDVLHVRALPTFGGVLRGHECELLLQYLTVPPAGQRGPVSGPSDRRHGQVCE